jgi:hypothetical protein
MDLDSVGIRRLDPILAGREGAGITLAAPRSHPPATSLTGGIHACLQLNKHLTLPALEQNLDICPM